MIKKIRAPHKFFLNDPKLCIQSLSDTDLVSLHSTGQLHNRPNSTWYKITPFIVARMEPYSDNKSVIVHVYIASKWQQKGLLKHAVKDIISFLKRKTAYERIIVPIPETCEHVIRTMEPLDFIYAGTVPKQLMWRNEKIDLLYYTRNIKWQQTVQAESETLKLY